MNNNWEVLMLQASPIHCSTTSHPLLDCGRYKIEVVAQEDGPNKGACLYVGVNIEIKVGVNAVTINRYLSTLCLGVDVTKDESINTLHNRLFKFLCDKGFSNDEAADASASSVRKILDVCDVVQINGKWFIYVKSNRSQLTQSHDE